MTQPIGLGPSTSKFTLVDESPPWPVPEVVGHEVEATFMSKSAVVDLFNFATGKGWTVLVTHAKGSFPTVGQKSSVQRHSLAVRMARKNERAVAVYVEDINGKTWKWDTLYHWTLAETFPMKVATITEFRTLL
jgi:hypothetical protein